MLRPVSRTVFALAVVAIALIAFVTFGSLSSNAKSTQVLLDPADSIRIVRLAANDIIFNPADQKIYASIPSSVGPGGNSIAALDPLTGALGAPVWVGSEPTQLALANDGQNLYVFLSGAYAIRKFDFTTQTPGSRFSLGQDSFFGLYTSNDFRVSPDDPNLIAVSRYYLGTSPPEGGTAIFKNGVKLPNAGPGHIEGTDYNVFANSTTLYGTNYAGIKTMTIDANGLTVQPTTISTGANSRLKLDNGILYTSAGQMVNPTTRVLLGTFPGAASVAFTSDSSVGRAYYLVRNQSLINTWTLKAYDVNTFTLIGSLDITNVQGDATSLVRWGTNGLAFRTTLGQVFLVQTSLIPTNDPLPTPPPVPTPTPSPTPANTTTFVRRVNVPANDVLLDDALNTVLLSVPGIAGAGVGNTITHVDPSTGQVTGSYFIGSEPNKLALSDDGQTLYAVLDGANSMRRYDVSTHTPGLQWSVTPTFFRPPDMRVMPGNAKILAVAAGFNGVGIFDDGVQRPNISKGGAYAVNSIAFGSNPNTIYGYDWESSGFELVKLIVDPQGVTGTLIGENLLSGYSNQIRFSNGLLYSAQGRVIDPETKVVAGTYQGGGTTFAVDAPANRVYFLSGNTLSVHQLDTFIKLGTVNVPFSGTPTSLARWGQNGLVFRAVNSSTDSFVYLVQSALIDPSIPVPTGMQLSSSTYGAFEGSASVTVTVTRTGDLSRATNIDFSTVNGTAVAGSDFVAQSGTLAFAAGDSSKNIVIQILNDNIFEGTENFGVVLSNPTGTGAQVVSPSSANISISDNDPQPLVTGTNVTVQEPSQGALRQINIPVQLSNPSVQTVSVNYATVSGTAQAGTDFISTSGNLTFNPLETSKSISITVLGDNVIEGNENFFISLTSPVNATINNGQVSVTIQNLNNTARVFDFDGDGKTDISIYRPSAGEWWYSRSSDAQVKAGQFGSSTDIITPGDFTGDGKADIAFYRPSTGFWYILRSEDGSFFSFPFGTAEDIPMPADFDGDGKTDAAVFRPSTGTWFILQSSGAGTGILQFGANGDKPVSFDYDGDGKADIGIVRDNLQTGNKEWWILRSTQGILILNFGIPGDLTVPGDYTGDGKADVAFFRPSTGFWYILRSEDNSFFSFPFGTNGDIPTPGDYDGDGKTDAAVFRPSTSTWFVNRSGGSGVLIAGFGLPTDQPVPSSLVR
jgi:hypothetical protein